MELPQIYINLDYFFQLGNLSMPVLIWRLFLDGGWILIAWVILAGLGQIWQLYRAGLWAKTIDYTLLAINVPKHNEQTPKAVEHLFSALAGTYVPRDWIDRWWTGMFPLSISFEIVSIEGYVQYLVHCPERTRDLIEAAVYSQYPDAEIVEVDEYADRVPQRYPDPEYDLSGAEYVLKKSSAYPIRTHLEFEHNLSEEYFKDPMAGLLEVFSGARPGEQVWLQVIITPNDGSWKDKTKDAVNEILGKKPKNSSSGSAVIDGLLEWPKLILNQLIGLEIEGGSAPEEKKSDNPMMNLTPADKKLLEQVQMKATKHGFDTTIRMVYIAKKEVFNRFRLTGAVGSALGILSQLNSNSLKRFSKVVPKPVGFIGKRQAPTKQRNLLINYKERSNTAGAAPFVLNIEELATIWHFPYRFNKAPSVQKTEAKRAEPPAGLPLAVPLASSPFVPKGSGAASPPPNVPMVQEEDEEGEE